MASVVPDSSAIGQKMSAVNVQQANGPLGHVLGRTRHAQLERLVTLATICAADKGDE
jgi:hypothetical protein